MGCLRVCWLVVLLFIFCSALAQDYTVKFLGIENGLSNNAVMSIYQDAQGFLWFGTYDGLNRYDGYEFRTYRNRIGDSTSLPSNTVFAIEGDANYRLWVGGQKGASVYNPLQSAFSLLYYKPVARDVTLPLNTNVHCIKKIAQQHMLIGAGDAGLIFYENATGTGRQMVLEEGGMQRYTVTAVEAGVDADTVWVFIQGKGLHKFSISAKTLTLVSSEINHAGSLTHTSRGLWMGNNNGLFLFNPLNRTYSKNYLPVPNPVISTMIDGDKKLWIATDGGGVFTLNDGESVAHPLKEVSSFPLLKSNSVWRILEDKEGRKWIGTLRGGLSIIEPDEKLFKNFLYTSKSETVADNFILSFSEDPEQNLWIGTDGAGLRYWNRRQNRYTEYRSKKGEKGSLSSNFITNILCDSYKNVWISTWFGGVNRFNASTGNFEQFSCFNPKTNNIERNIWLLYEDADKALWASASNPGSLYRLNRTKMNFELFDDSIADLQALTETRNGEFWGGNYNTLINIDRQHKNHIRYHIGYTVRCIFEDSRNNLWVGTQEGGLLLINRRDGTFKRYTEADGLPGNTILRMLEDSTGALWMSTYNGLSKFIPTQQSFYNFSISDGLQSNQFSFNAGLKLQSGELVFGGINGFTLFDAERITNEEKEIPVLLNGVTVSNIPVKANSPYVEALNADQIKKIELPWDKAIVSIDFLALAYTGSDKINYAYQLAGWDKAWNYVQKNRRANYARLNEGNYVFKVKLSGVDGKWGNETVLLDIRVLPPWYRTWWAYAMAGMLVVGAVFMYNRYTRRQERLKYEVKLVNLERVKDKELAEKQFSVFTNVSHEFRTHLSLITSPLKRLVSSYNNSKELNTAFRNSRRLLSLVDQLLLFKKADADTDTLKVSVIHLPDLCKEVFGCFDTLAADKKLTYSFDNRVTNPTVFGDYEKIEIALFNIVSNAFKFTERGSIRIELTESDEYISICVQDTGCGIAPEDKEKIFKKFEQATGSGKHKNFGFGVGLYLVQNFVNRHKGNIQCESEPGRGTTMTLRFLKGKNHLDGNIIWQQSAQRINLLEELAVFETAEPDVWETVSESAGGKEASEIVTDKKSILVVDDNKEMRDYLAALFSVDYLLYTAADGNEGLALAEKMVPDMVISDVNMGEMDGVELCLRIKQHSRLSHIPVILLTAVDAAEVRLKGVASGADDYITKPFDDELLLAKIESTLKNRLELRKYFLDSVTLHQSDLKVPVECQEFLQNCIRVVENNIDNEAFTIKSFCSEMGMSHSALYNKVKTVSGQTLNAFIRTIRIRRAAVMMLTSDVNISQAAYLVGIGDVRYFREQFVKLFGMNPSEYIKKYKHNFNAELNIVKNKA